MIANVFAWNSGFDGSTDEMQQKVFMCLFGKFFPFHQTSFLFCVLMIVLIQMGNGLWGKVFAIKGNKDKN